MHRASTVDNAACYACLFACSLYMDTCACVRCSKTSGCQKCSTVEICGESLSQSRQVCMKGARQVCKQLVDDLSSWVLQSDVCGKITATLLPEGRRLSPTQQINMTLGSELLLQMDKKGFEFLDPQVEVEEILDVKTNIEFTSNGSKFKLGKLGIFDLTVRSKRIAGTCRPLPRFNVKCPADKRFENGECVRQCTQYEVKLNQGGCIAPRASSAIGVHMHICMNAALWVHTCFFRNEPDPAGTSQIERTPRLQGRQLLRCH